MQVKSAALAILYHAMLVPVVSEAEGVGQMLFVLCKHASGGIYQYQYLGKTTVCMTSIVLRPRTECDVHAYL